MTRLHQLGIAYHLPDGSRISAKVEAAVGDLFDEFLGKAKDLIRDMTGRTDIEITDKTVRREDRRATLPVESLGAVSLPAPMAETHETVDAAGLAALKALTVAQPAEPPASASEPAPVADAPAEPAAPAHRARKAA